MQGKAAQGPGGTHPCRRSGPRGQVHEVCVYTHDRSRRVGVVTTINQSGLFLRAQHLLPEATRVRLEFFVERQVLMEVEGEVVDRITADRARTGGPTGMGVRFVDLEAPKARLIADLVERTRGDA